MALKVVKPQEDKGTLYHISTRKGTVNKAVRCRSAKGEDCGRVHIVAGTQKDAQAFTDKVVQAQEHNARNGIVAPVDVPFQSYAARVGEAKARQQLAQGALTIFDYAPQQADLVQDIYQEYTTTTFEEYVYHDEHKYAGEPLDAVGANGKPKFSKTLFNDSHFFGDKDVYTAASVTKTNLFKVVEAATTMLLREDYDPSPKLMEQTIQQRVEMARNLQSEFANMKTVSTELAERASELSQEAKELTERAKEQKERDVKASFNAEAKLVREEAAGVRKMKTVVDAVTDEQKRRRDAYRDITARLVERQRNIDPVASNVPSWHMVQDQDDIGAAKCVKDAPTFGSPEWAEQRQTIMGGTDVAALVKHVFENRSINSTGDSKIKPIELQPKNDEQAINPINTSYEGEERTYNNFGAGGAYRGNAWEPRIIKELAEDYAETFEVYTAKGQYASSDPMKPFQVFNIDGVLVDKESQKLGMAEAKNITNDADNGMKPVRIMGDIDNMDQGYRGQVLYYLDATGLDFAVVRIQENDYTVTDYVLHADDSVHRDTDMKIDEFVSQHVAPFWAETQQKRRDNWFSYTEQFEPEVA